MLQSKPTHSLFWWYIKVLCGALLIIAFCLRFLSTQVEPLVQIPNLAAQAVIVLGAGVYFYHYRLLKGRNASIYQPTDMLTEAGLYRYVRHPMYLGDLILYLGFTMLMPHPATLAIYALAMVALHRQAKVEDDYLASLYPAAHRAWAKGTQLMVPGL